MKKRLSVFALILVLALSVVGVYATEKSGTDTWKASVVVCENDLLSYNGKNVVNVGFHVQSDSLKLKNLQSICIAFDLKIFDFVFLNGDGKTVRAYSDSITCDLSGNIGSNVYSVFNTGMEESWQCNLYAAKSQDGNTGYLIVQPYSTSETSCDKEIELASVLLGYKSGKGASDLKTTSIRIVNEEETTQLCQSQSIILTDGKANTGVYGGKIDSSIYSEIQEPQIVWELSSKPAVDKSGNGNSGTKKENSLGNSDNKSAAYTDSDKNKRAEGTISLQIGNYAATVDGFLSKIDSDNNNVIPYIKNDRTFVPLRFISEKLKAEVLWDGNKREVTVRKDGQTIIVPIGADYYLLNGVSYKQDAPAEIVQDRTFIPIRFVAEALNNSVYWDAEDYVVIISPKGYPWTGDNELEKELLSDYLFIMSPLVRDFQL